MLGAIAGDIIGSIYEFGAGSGESVPLFSLDSHYTDETLLTVATASILMEGGDYARAYCQAFQDEPHQAWGGMFARWAASGGGEPYGSFGNGSAMWVSPVGFWAKSREEALTEARRSAEATHNHPEGIKGAQATALAIYLARQGASADLIRTDVSDLTGYDLTTTWDELLRTSSFNETCQGTVPPALIIALEAGDFEAAMRRCLSLDADTDTPACIAGGMAEALWGLPDDVAEEVAGRLPDGMQDTVVRFQQHVAERDKGSPKPPRQPNGGAA